MAGNQHKTSQSSTLAMNGVPPMGSTAKLISFGFLLKHKHALLVAWSLIISLDIAPSRSSYISLNTQHLSGAGHDPPPLPGKSWATQFPAQKWTSQTSQGIVPMTTEISCKPLKSRSPNKQQDTSLHCHQIGKDEQSDYSHKPEKLKS